MKTVSLSSVTFLALVCLLLFLSPPSSDPTSLSLTTCAAAEESAVEIDANAADDKCGPGKKCDADAEAADDAAEDDDVDVSDDEDDDEDADDEDDDEASEPEEDKPAVIDPEGSEGDASYDVPAADGAAFFDSFQASELKQWVYTEADSYEGKFAIGQGKAPTFKGDRALIIPQKARKYGLSAAVSGLSADKPLVVQYEVKVEDGHTCGGAYVKLPLPGFDGKKLDGDTPYSVMFGPDKCGGTDKVHFIFQSEHPDTGKRREHHLAKTPSTPSDLGLSADTARTHLYTLIVHPNMEFEVRIDGERKANGTLDDEKVFTPAVQLPKKIPDPEDKKPKDWVDDEKIADPDATKPDDWDEDAPREIVDEEATKPDGWLDDEPEQVPDPKATKPDEWDDDEDGEWEAPQVPNPKCAEVGCGEWKKPMKKNPAFKGKWSAPLIDNPKYIGKWAPREIDNPDYYKVDEVKLLPVGGVALELWTMDQGMLFDNVWIGNDVDKLEAFTEKTYGAKKASEDEKEKEAAAKTKAEEKEKESEMGDDDEPEGAEDEDADADAEEGSDESEEKEKDEL